MRKIEKKLVDWLDKKLEKNGLAQDAIQKKDARVLFGQVAQACVGIREQGGNNKGPLVELFQETIGTAEQEPWCMGFVQSMIAYCELKCGVTSPVFASEHCMTVWAKTAKTQRVKKIPAAFAIAIWNYVPGQSGHTGILISYNDKRMNLVEGNTESGLTKSGAIERDGGGVYFTDRSTGSGKKMKLIGFLKPF